MIELNDYSNKDQKGTLEHKDGLLIIRLFNEPHAKFMKLHVKPTPEMSALIAAIDKQAKVTAKEEQAKLDAARVQGEANKAAVEARKAGGGKPPQPSSPA